MNQTSSPTLIYRVSTLVLGLGLCVVPGHAQDSPVGQHLDPLKPTPSAEWWRESWREGWTYEHHANFSLTAQTRVTAKEKVEWWQELIAGRVEDAVGELNLAVNGTSLATTGVASDKGGEILLFRHYPRVDVNRALFREAIGEPTLFDMILEGAIKDDVRGPLMTNAFGILGRIIGVGVGGHFGNPEGLGKIGGFAGAFLGAKSDSLISAALKDHGIQVREGGGVEISTNSPLVKNTTAAGAANLALQLSEAFNRRMFMIRAAKDTGDMLQTRQIYEEGNDLVTFGEMAAKEGRDKAVDWLRSRMLAYNVPEGIVQGSLQRESFALASDIFDSKKRKIGDVWIVPADFFNSFLHPDLKGRFRGKVVLRYQMDAEVPSRRHQQTVYQARVIEILNRGEVDGRVHESTMEYAEDRFSAKLRSDTQATLFIDKDSGYVRQADLLMQSDTQAGLPDMRILNGFELRGVASFDVNYDCTATPPAP